MVIASIGHPAETNYSTFGNDEQEQWCYGFTTKFAFGWGYIFVYFENGAVTGTQSIGG